MITYRHPNWPSLKEEQSEKLSLKIVLKHKVYLLISSPTLKAQLIISQ